jgi:hypothetical protein
MKLPISTQLKAPGCKPRKAKLALTFNANSRSTYSLARHFSAMRPFQIIS